MNKFNTLNLYLAILKELKNSIPQVLAGALQITALSIPPLMVNMWMEVLQLEHQ